MEQVRFSLLIQTVCEDFTSLRAVGKQSLEKRLQSYKTVFAAALSIPLDRLSLRGVTQAMIAICSSVLQTLPIIYTHMYKYMCVHVDTYGHTFIDIHFCLLILVCLFLSSGTTLLLSILKLLVNLMTKLNSGPEKTPNAFQYLPLCLSRQSLYNF